MRFIQLHETQKANLTALVFFALTFFFLCISEGTYDTGDGVQHYLIARYAPSHPLLLLNHWGKPLFTLLCMPFAQFGFLGSKLYNLCCVTLCALFTFKTAHYLHMKRSWMAVPLVCFSPLLYICTFSGLTEPTFAMVIAAGVMFIACEKYFWAALIVSFLPFARTEGFFILPVFACYLILRKQWKSIPWMCFGTLLYSMLGWYYLDDFFWIVSNNPYRGAAHLYGHGTLTHFIAANDRLFGLPQVVLFLFGILATLRNNNEIKPIRSWLLILVIGSFGVYFMMHSIFWWKGLCGSLGLHRVMAGIAPMVSLVALVGFNQMMGLVPSKKIFHQTITTLICLAVIIYPFKQYHQPLQASDDVQVCRQAAVWIEAQQLHKNSTKIFCDYPYLNMLVEHDIFDAQKHSNISPRLIQQDEKFFKLGDLLLWDSHFAAETGMSIALIEQAAAFKPLKQFASVNNGFKVMVYQYTGNLPSKR